MPGGQLESGSQCTHSGSQRTQNIPGWQRHWVFCLLVQGAVSSKPSTDGGAGVLSRGAALWEVPALPGHITTHSGHRGGTAGRWRDGSSARCRNFQGTWHKLCLGCGYIRMRRACLESGGGQECPGTELPPSPLLLLRDLGLPHLGPTHKGWPVSLSLTSDFPGRWCPTCL